MGLAEAFRNLFRPEQQNIHDLIVQSEQRLSGWYRDTDKLGRFLGYSWACPGKVIRATMPAPRGSSEAEVPIQQRVGCSCVIGTFTPAEDGIQHIDAKCGQCGTASSLATYLRERNISSKDLPTRMRTTPATQPRALDTWSMGGSNDDGYEYECSVPGGLF